MSSAQNVLLYGVGSIDMMFKLFSSNFEDDHWTRRHGELHSARWILAHLVHSLHKAAGSESMPAGLDGRFQYGAPPEDDTSGWPATAELLAAWDGAVAALRAAWSARDEADWSEPLPENPLGARTRAESAMFAVQHAVYHVGQLGAIRRLNGLQGKV